MEHFLVANTHDHLLFFTNRGKVYRLRAYELPEQGRDAQGQNLINLLAIEQGERATAVALLNIPNFEASEYLVFGTRKGESEAQRADAVRVDPDERAAGDGPGRGR